tara:strand:- start:4675 stop:6090 length:1416 start_codon:yes stop_codon:yes gene_type:complete
MAWPTNKPDSNKFSADTDSIKESRPELNTMSQAVNDIVDFVDTTGIADGKILKYNASNARLEVADDGGIENPILLDGSDSAGGVQGSIELSGSSLQLGFAQTTSNAPRLDLTTDNGVNAAKIDMFIEHTSGTANHNFQGGSVTFYNGFTNHEFKVNMTHLRLNGRDATVGNFPINSITTNNQSLMIAAISGVDVIPNGNTTDYVTDMPASLDGPTIVLKDDSGDIYINTRREDSAGGGSVYINRLKYPNADGTNNQVLTTDGSGNLSFANQASSPNLWNQFQADSGSTTANTTTDTLTVSGGTGISTSISGDTLTITSTSSGGVTNITGGDNIAVANPDSAGDFEISLSQLSAVLNCNDQQLSNMAIKNYGEIIHDLGTTGGTITPDPNNGSVQKITLNNNLTLNSLSSVANGDSITLIVRQDGTGNRTLSSTMKFAGGTKTLSTGANAIDIITIFYDGTDYLASLSTNFS